jgi:hypothetical protein
MHQKHYLKLRHILLGSIYIVNFVGGSRSCAELIGRGLVQAQSGLGSIGRCPEGPWQCSMGFCFQPWFESTLCAYLADQD